MMTNPTENHEQIAGKIGAPLTLAMDALGCRGDQGGMRVQRDENGHGRDKPEPDIVVRCGPRQNRHLRQRPAGDRRGAVAEHHGSRPRAQALPLQALLLQVPADAPAHRPCLPGSDAGGA
ncbi:hypothetical protein [Methylobacterium currus]|uniref:hypothetical protein n=1 Tax=Methylobacterium currus TaxID=2051553 RepID=UPI0030B84757